MGKFFISCDEATAVCDKNQYKEASFLEKLKLSVHLFLCKKCGAYTKQNGIITKACNAHLHKHSTHPKLSEVDKVEIQKKITQENSEDGKM